MENNSLISIVIPCYNDAQYIEQAVASALNQTYPYKEVIVVDDGSNAETKAVLKKLEPTITKLITQENQGQSTARNVGIKAAKGEFIVTLDSDDFFAPTFCEKAVPVLLNDISIKIVTCQANLLFEDGSTYIFTPRGGNIDNFLYSSDALGTSLFKKKDWEACSGYDERMTLGLEDWEFFIRLLKEGGSVYVIQEPLYNYRKRRISTTRRANKIKYELIEYIMLKNRNLYIQNFDASVKYLLFLAEQNKKNELKRLSTIDYKLGSFILFPFRKIKSFFKNE
ncbi:glycosyltransferase family A protein [Flavobacterium sp. UMI-01]|uniref:glycosyltransferase family 2 protein n=1 Tax=Flavobacterium sp. UMI-01 TaxID=1441053 RepID=UPI001C7DC6B0|nr:glycosyltransferase family A protein [Flavobacterium sp. UMI-01]GIZ07451.1 hypothetical protein FUMI01_01780 [Flavobacterium sp. UMI-01]